MTSQPSSFSLEGDDEGSLPLGEFLARFGVSRAQAYRYIADGQLVAKKNGRATLITFTSIRSWWKALPELKQRSDKSAPNPS